MTALRDLPAIRKLAERQTCDVVDALHAHRGMLSEHTEGALVEAQLDLLTDLSRPASQDAVARLVAKKLGGWEAWQIGQAISDGGDPWDYLLDEAGISDPNNDLGRLSFTAALEAIAVAVLS